MPFHPTTDKFATAFSLHTKHSQQKPLHYFEKPKIKQINKYIIFITFLGQQKSTQFLKDI